VNGVVVVAADPRRAAARGLGLEIEHLADEPAFPEEPAIEPFPLLAQRLLEARHHREREEPVFRDVLIAREAIGDAAGVDGDEEKEVRALEASRVGWFPQEVGPHRRLPLLEDPRSRTQA